MYWVSRFSLLPFLALLAPLSAVATPSTDFDRTLERHLTAIEQRDLDGLLTTVSQTPPVSLIFPNGERLVGKDAFRTVHTEWFADTQWRMDVEEISRNVGADMASVLLRYTLRDVPEPGQGNPRSAWLSLVFQHIDGEWLLVYDQNTRITPPAAASTPPAEERPDK